MASSARLDKAGAGCLLGVLQTLSEHRHNSFKPTAENGNMRFSLWSLNIFPKNNPLFGAFSIRNKSIYSHKT